VTGDLAPRLRAIYYLAGRNGMKRIALGGGLALLLFVLALMGQAPASTGERSERGTNGNDILYSTEGRDILFGLAGNDVLSGGGGDDVFYDGPGNDEIYGGDGFDRLYTCPDFDYETIQDVERVIEGSC
jgi:Ca2+-binding RTX toxin-like protein